MTARIVAAGGAAGRCRRNQDEAGSRRLDHRPSQRASQACALVESRQETAENQTFKAFEASRCCALWVRLHRLDGLFEYAKGERLGCGKQRPTVKRDGSDRRRTACGIEEVARFPDERSFVTGEPFGKTREPLRRQALCAEARH
ncbi:hypothetical protein MMMDOFMJ_4543 [Methylobacterium gnaphalii]|nr:hypothetical protein MMMDOFMJ_4543 [Methylobacterium gnaphalii]